MWQPRREHACPLACDPVILCLADLTGAETLPWGIAYPEGAWVDIKRLPRLESMHCVGAVIVCVPMRSSSVVPHIASP